ncbi:hypothetical protein GCM10020221_11410 [Streptomyces thioluteus]|uniref:Uncharacterized protein n=1 Tax=Streptomyces thioluteus TaxID=66431 RepID=A0ABN3WLD3_STRTU
MPYPRLLPRPEEMFRSLAKREFKNQAEIARFFGTSEAAVSQALSEYKEPRINYRELLPLPWQKTLTGNTWRNARPARALRLHLRAMKQPHELSAADAEAHAEWIEGLATHTLEYTEEHGWKYVPRRPDHSDFVVILPEDHDLAEDVIKLYRKSPGDN